MTQAILSLICLRDTSNRPRRRYRYYPIFMCCLLNQYGRWLRLLKKVNYCSCSLRRSLPLTHNVIRIEFGQRLSANEPCACANHYFGCPVRAW